MSRRQGRSGRGAPWARLAALGLWLGSALALAADPAVQEMVDVLRERGLIDAAEGARILAKSAAAQEPKLPGYLDQLQLFGDMRARGEWFAFDRDFAGGEDDDFFRARYRLRLGLRKQLGERAALGWMLASNVGNPRGDNQTMGGNPDFEPDEIRIQRAFVRFDLPQTGFGLRSSLLAGRAENPYRWNLPGDALVWDPDLNLEGASLLGSLGETPARLYASAGSYVIEQQSAGSDSMLYALQLGGQLQLRSALAIGLRASSYQYRALSAEFLEHAAAGGNLPNAFDDRHAHVGELGASLSFTPSTRWPLSAFASVTRNFSASRAVLAGASGAALPVGAQDDAILVGLELGNAAEVLRLGAGLFRLEANGVIAPFTDSDLFDGLTNVQGYYAFVLRELRPGVQLRLWLSDTDSLRESGGAAGPFAASLADRDRLRVQADVMLAF